MTKETEKYAQLLLDIQAVNLRPDQPFTWTSGLRSPIYCDNRLVISHPQCREEIETGLVNLIKTHYPDVEVIAGTATAGIPHAAIIAHLLDLPMIYVRSQAKGHGKQNAIEGQLLAGQKVVMIEDLISTGGSVIEAADKVAQAGGQVLGCLAIFNYCLDKSRQAFDQAGYDLVSLTNYEALLQLVKQNQIFSPDQEKILAQWHHDPELWSQKY
ncbi:Orotate phosphoribosyltransferase [Aerococcus urinaehominis]|uniref:Orotate phosphoribosyltransferase n=1 Tax=Aerococcus urinaehominis TaxID=128944 RepID=A0A109RGN0_9LACT|nr:orotate phosphoribosyltransferase [Aerococcus urinaehominis]AMB99084.1 Orotate phosphoribosyltransferase [Aerococcus urinaehominis]SDM03098.1 orotate phosphoribosyltransferase [Aerococcus urinaehominis]